MFFLPGIRGIDDTRSTQIGYVYVRRYYVRECLTPVLLVNEALKTQIAQIHAFTQVHSSLTTPLRLIIDVVGGENTDPRTMGRS